MRARALISSLVLPLLTACASIPVVGGQSDDERRAPCDRLSAQAIQVESLEEATRLAAEASECYSRASTGD